MSDNRYQVAGHIFRLSFPNNVLFADSLSNYTPFCVPEDTEEYLFHLSVTEALPVKDTYEKIGQFDDDIASIGIFKSKAGSFCFRIAAPGSQDYCTMYVDSLFREARVQLPNDERAHFFCLNNCLMLLYAFSTSNLNTLLIHASVIKNNGGGFAFLGKSGTGKSTHSHLWLEHVEGSELLNDDNPAVRIIEGKAYVFGTPWSGKTPCYKNDGVLLKAIVKLYQSPENRIKQVSSLQSYAVVLPACSNMRWEDDIASGIHQTVEKLIGLVGCFQLYCLPDKEAAELCSEITRED